MKNILKYIPAFILLLTMSSCEDVIQVKLDKGTPIVTIDAFVNDLRQQQKIRLTYTDAYFSQQSNPGISGASVKITDLNTAQVFTFTDKSNGDYTLDITPGDTIGRVGHKYTLEVIHQGITYTSTTELKRTTTIDTIDVKYKAPTQLNPKEGYKCSFLGKDPEGPIPDFYWIKSYRNGVFYGKGSEINLAYDAANGAGADGFYFTPPIAEGITPFGELFQKNDICRVEIHSISEQTYNFLIQAQAQLTNSGLFATTPENVKTNISSSSDKVKIVGWFSMSAVSFKERVVE